MVHLRYPKDGYFTDRKRDERYEGPCEANVPEDAVEQYLARGWERIEVDDVEYTREELEELSYNDLRQMAAEAHRDDVDGSSKRTEIVDAFAVD